MSESSTSPISLSSLMQPSKVVTMDFPGYEGFSVDICFLAREELVKLRKKCVSTKWDKRKHQPEEVLDEDKFLKLYVSSVVKGWSGFKYSYLEEFLLVDVSSLDPNDCLPFSVENAVELMKNSNDFDSWVTESANNLENFTPNK